MIEAGVLKNPDVDAIVGLHLWNNLPLGTVGVRSGALMAAVECFRAHIFWSKGTRCDAASNRRFGCCCCPSCDCLANGGSQCRSLELR